MLLAYVDIELFNGHHAVGKGSTSFFLRGHYPSLYPMSFNSHEKMTAPLRRRRRSRRQLCLAKCSLLKSSHRMTYTPRTQQMVYLYGKVTVKQRLEGVYDVAANMFEDVEVALGLEQDEEDSDIDFDT